MLVMVKFTKEKGILSVTSEEDCCVFPNYTKNGKCWHVCNIGKQAWKGELVKDKFRLLM